MQLTGRYRSLRSSRPICLVVLLASIASSCRSTPSPLNICTDDTIFPPSKDLLHDTRFERLKNYRLAYDVGKPGTAIELWGDQPFLANTNVTLRYKHQQRADKTRYLNQPQYCAVGVGLDLRYPLDGPRKTVAEAFLNILENHWKTPLTQVRASMQKHDWNAIPVEMIQFPAFIAEVEVREMPQRGSVLSTDFYERASYENDHRGAVQNKPQVDLGIGVISSLLEYRVCPIGSELRFIETRNWGELRIARTELGADSAIWR